MDELCEEIIKFAWITNDFGLTSFKVVQKIKYVKTPSNKWNQEVFGFCDTSLQDLYDALPKARKSHPSKDNLRIIKNLQ